jgi:hypothetical protein
MRKLTPWAASAVILSGVVLAACGGGDDGPSGNNDQSIQVTASPSSLNLGAGTSGTVTVTLVRGGGFSAAVNVSVTGLPPGIGVSVDPSSLTGNTLSALVTVTVGASVAAGTYNATVRASATGVGEVTASYSVVVSAAGNFSLAASPALTITQGAAAQNATVSITRTNFTGVVNLSLVSPPAGVSAVFTPAAATGTSSTMAVTVAGSAAAGNHTLTIQGSAPDLASLEEAGAASAVGIRTTTLALTVNAAGNSSVALAPASGALSIQQGNAGQTSVAITRTNFTGTVNLTSAGAPNGMMVTFDPPATTGGTSTMNVNVGGAVTPATYPITITGSGAGIANAQATVNVTVTSASGGTAVEYRFPNDGVSDPVYFSCRSGTTGSWTVVTGVLEGNLHRYRCTITTTRGSVYFVQRTGTPAVVPRVPSRLGALAGQQVAMRTAVAARRAARVRTGAAAAFSYFTTIHNMTASELQSTGTQVDPATNKSVSVPWSNIPSGQFGFASLGGASETINPGTTPNPVTVTEVPDRPLDVLGVRTGGQPDLTPDRVFLLRNQNPANGSTLSTTMNMTGPLSDVVATRTGTIGNLMGDQWAVFSSFGTSRGAAAALGFFPLPTTAASRPIYGLPASLANDPGDRHTHVFFATPPVNPNDARGVFITRQAMQDETVTLPGRMAPPLVSVIDPQLRLVRVDVVAPTGTLGTVTASLTNQNGSVNRTIVTTAGFLAAPAPAPGGAAMFDTNVRVDDQSGGLTAASALIASFFLAGPIELELESLAYNNAACFQNPLTQAVCIGLAVLVFAVATLP